MKNYNEITTIMEALQRTGLPIAPAPCEGRNEPAKYYYRNNPDGTIRWVWPAGSRSAWCLKFYYPGTRRARMFSGLIRLLFAVRLGRLFASGSFTAYGKINDDLALFTGTAGPNRKMLLYQKGRFTKIALSPRAELLIRREAALLAEWAERDFAHIRLPRLLGLNNSCLVIEELAAHRSRKPVADGESSCRQAIQELANISPGSSPIWRTSWWREAMDRLSLLKSACDSRLPNGMIRKLCRLAASVPVDKRIVTCRAHGDLTPWNMVNLGRHVGIFDWELSFDEAPCLFDTLHYIIQTAILRDHEDECRIWQSLRSLHQENGQQDWLQLKLYLLMQCSYYLTIYHQQEHWHCQVHWLLRTWNGLLNLLLDQEGLLNQRQLFCMDLFDELRNQPYAALKWLPARPEDLREQSDIDLCVAPKARTAIDCLAARHPFIKSCKIRSRSFMQSYTLLFLDESLLSVDAIGDLRRKHLRMLDAAEVIWGAKFDAVQVKIPPPAMDLAYLELFYLLNGAPVPERYRAWAERRLSCQPEAIAAAFVYDDRRRRDALQMLCLKKDNRGCHRLLHRLQYAADSLRELLGRRGFVVTFSGVDGAGKSTVIEQVRQQLEKKWRRKVVVLRHRPGMIPILSAWKKGKVAAEKEAAENLPRQGNNHNAFSSMLRFLYYYTDYLLGQFYIRFRYVCRGYIVLYDRYYFDLINDSRRTNMVLPPGLTTFFYRLLLKPAFNFFLYAPEKVILARKRELDAPAIRQLTSGYLRLFRTLARRYKSSQYISVLNTNLDATVTTITRHLKSSIT